MLVPSYAEAILPGESDWRLLRFFPEFHGGQNGCWNSNEKAQGRHNGIDRD